MERLPQRDHKLLKMLSFACQHNLHLPWVQLTQSVFHPQSPSCPRDEPPQSNGLIVGSEIKADFARSKAEAPGFVFFHQMLDRSGLRTALMGLCGWSHEGWKHADTDKSFDVDL